MAAGRHDFTLEQGATFNPTLRYTQRTFVKKPITGVTNSGRAVATAVAHGLAVDWSGYVVGIVGMDLLNHQSKDLNVPSRAYEARVLTADTLELQVDTSRFGAYVSGGEFLYRAPFDFTSYTARMQIRADAEDTDPVAGGDLTTENGGIALGGVNGTIALLIAGTVTAALDVGTYVYDLEIVSPGGAPTAVLYGNINVPRREVTR